MIADLKIMKAELASWIATKRNHERDLIELNSRNDEHRPIKQVEDTYEKAVLYTKKGIERADKIIKDLSEAISRIENAK